MPSKADLPFEERLAFLEATFGENGTHAAKHVVVVPHDAARDRAHVLDKLKEIEGLGGEGLMLRKPRSPYEGRRSNTLLKIKVSTPFPLASSLALREYMHISLFPCFAVPLFP